MIKEIRDRYNAQFRQETYKAFFESFHARFHKNIDFKQKTNKQNHKS